MDDESLVRLVRRLAGQHGRRLTPSAVIRSEEDFPPQAAAKLLKIWGTIRPKTGLPPAPTRAAEKRVTHDDLMAEYDRIRTSLGKDPTWSELNRYALFSRHLYQDRIGRIADLREAHRQWADLRDRAAAGEPEAGLELRECAVAAGTILLRTPEQEDAALCPVGDVSEELQRLFAEAIGIESLTAPA